MWSDRMVGARLCIDAQPFSHAAGNAGDQSGGWDEMVFKHLHPALQCATPAARACFSGPVQGGND